MTDADLGKLLANNSLRSPEVLELYHLINRTDIPNYIFPDEIIVLNNFHEITEEAFVTGKGSLFSQLVETSGIDKLGKEQLTIVFTFKISKKSEVGIFL